MNYFALVCKDWLVLEHHGLPVVFGNNLIIYAIQWNQTLKNKEAGHDILMTN